jgi:hypothetical protein
MLFLDVFCAKLLVLCIYGKTNPRDRSKSPRTVVGLPTHTPASMALFVLFAALSPAALRTAPIGRRVVCFSGLTAASAVLPCSAATMEPLTASAKLTAREYVATLQDARRGLEEVRPLLELKEDRGYEAARIALRQAPVSGIRKACSKLLLLVADGSETKALKTKQYDAIKAGLGDLDQGCRPEVTKDNAKLLQLLTKLEGDLNGFGDGLGLVDPAEKIYSRSASEILDGPE